MQTMLAESGDREKILNSISHSLSDAGWNEEVKKLCQGTINQSKYTNESKEVIYRNPSATIEDISREVEGKAQGNQIKHLSISSFF